MYKHPTTNSPTEPQLHTIRTARLQMSPIRLDGALLPSPKSTTKNPTNTSTTIHPDYEMVDLDTTASPALTTQHSPPTPAAHPSRPAKPSPQASANGSISSESSGSAGGSISSESGSADRAPITCICRTCEREASEAQEAAALHLKWGFTKRRWDGC